MAEYIEREATCKGCVRYGMGETLCADCVVKVAPAADVVPVVRCKDCKHSGMYCFGASDKEQLACLDIEEDGFIRFASAVSATITAPTARGRNNHVKAKNVY